MAENSENIEIKRNKGGNPAWVKGGKSPNPTGKPKGVTHAATKEIREFLQTVMQNNLPKLQKDLDKMLPFHKWQILCRLSDKFLPTLTHSDLNANFGGETKIVVSFVPNGSTTEVKSLHQDQQLIDSPKIIDVEFTDIKLPDTNSSK